MYGARFPMREPGLLGGLQVVGGLTQGRHHGGQLLDRRLLRRPNCRLTPFFGRLLADRIGLLPGLGHDLRGLGVCLGHVLGGLGGQVVEVERDGVRIVRRIGDSNDGSHAANRRRSGGRWFATSLAAAICCRAFTSLRRIGPAIQCGEFGRDDASKSARPVAAATKAQATSGSLGQRPQLASSNWQDRQNRRPATESLGQRSSCAPGCSMLAATRLLQAARILAIVSGPAARFRSMANCRDNRAKSACSISRNVSGSLLSRSAKRRMIST